MSQGPSPAVPASMRAAELALLEDGALEDPALLDDAADRLVAEELLGPPPPDDAEVADEVPPRLPFAAASEPVLPDALLGTTAPWLAVDPDSEDVVALAADALLVRSADGAGVELQAEAIVRAVAAAVPRSR